MSTIWKIIWSFYPLRYKCHTCSNFLNHDLFPLILWTYEVYWLLRIAWEGSENNQRHNKLKYWILHGCNIWRNSWEDGIHQTHFFLNNNVSPLIRDVSLTLGIVPRLLHQTQPPSSLYALTTWHSWNVKPHIYSSLVLSCELSHILFN